MKDKIELKSEAEIKEPATQSDKTKGDSIEAHSSDDNYFKGSILYSDEYEKNSHKLSMGYKKTNTKRSLDDEHSKINAFTDEYDRALHLSQKNTQIAIKQITNYVSPYKHAITETLAVCLHSIAEGMHMVHMSGTHLRGYLKYVGVFAEAASEIIHHPSGEAMEKLVCGSMVGFTKEGINILVAIESGVAVGLASSLTTTPAGGMAAMSIVTVASYKMADKITTPLAHIVQNKCHTMFQNSNTTEKSLAINPQHTENQEKNKPEFTYTDLLNAQLSLLNNNNGSVKSVDSGIERLQNHLSALQQSSTSSSKSQALTTHSSSTKQLSEHLYNLNNSHNTFTNALTSTRVNDFSQFTNQSRPTYHFDTAQEASRYTTFFSNYLHGNFCERPKPVNTNYSFWGGGSDDWGGKSSWGGHCDSRFQDCSSSSSSDCRSSGSDRCASTLF